MSSRALESLRGSRNRLLVLGILCESGPMRAEHVADRASLPPAVVLWTLHGHPPEYAFDLALVPLDLVRARFDALGAVYAATEAGKSAWEALSPVMRRGPVVQSVVPL